MSEEVLFFGWYFYPRPPRGGRRIVLRLRDFSLRISIHVLREEDDLLPVSGENALDISIHVLREEDDADTTTAS